MTVFVAYEAGFEGIERIVGVYSTRELADAQADRFDGCVEEFELDAVLAEPELICSSGSAFAMPEWLAARVRRELSHAREIAERLNREYDGGSKVGDTITVRLPERLK